MVAHWILLWVLWGTMIASVALAVVHKLRKNNEERRNGTYQE